MNAKDAASAASESSDDREEERPNPWSAVAAELRNASDRLNLLLAPLREIVPIVSFRHSVEENPGDGRR
jgi:hypothetical protein